MSNDVIITKHASNRFRERFRLMFHSEIFRERKESYLMKTLFEKATPVDFSLKQMPGKYTAICIKHGCKVDYHRFSDKVIFVSTLDENGVRLILTVMKVYHRVMNHQFM